MVYRKSYANRRYKRTNTTYRRKRMGYVARRRPQFGNITNRITKSPYNATVYCFKRKTSLGSVTIPAASVTGIVGAAQLFTFDMIPGYSEMTAMFDQYCITYVKWTLVFRSTGIDITQTTATAALGMPNIIIVRDYDDNTAPASNATGYSEIQQYQKAKAFTFTPERSAFTMGLVPAVSSEVYRSAITTGYSPKFKQYLDCNTPDIPHYGFKYCVQAPFNQIGSLGANYFFDIYATVYIKCKNVR